MNIEQLQSYLHSHIPITNAMEVEAVEVRADAVTLGAPLAPNTNHRNTAFGGSVSTLATLAAWSFLRIKLGADAAGVHLVIQRNSLEYLKPIDGYFTATACLGEGADWERFEQMLSVRGRGRISIEASVDYGGVQCAQFIGEFVALKQD